MPPLTHDPFVDGAWDAVFYAVGNFLIMAHPFRVTVNKWVEIVVAEAFVHAGEGYFRRTKKEAHSLTQRSEAFILQGI